VALKVKQVIPGKLVKGRFIPTKTTKKRKAKRKK
jgi:hypothetical protein